MRNRYLGLYDLNYPSKYITPNDLGGHLTSDLKSATLITLVSMSILPLMASEAFGGNMHMDTRVIKVADVKSEVK